MINTITHALTIDVEDYFQVAAFDDVVDRKEWANIKGRVEIGTDRFLQLIDEHQVQATFFILGWIAEKYPQLVRRIADQGHEVACHGYSHKLVYSQKSVEFQEETIRSKKILEDLAQQPVVGYRAASYSITEQSLWALEIIQEAGFSYDSSIYPIRHDRYGLQGGPHHPYRISLRNGAQLTEFPITTVKLGGYHLPVGGGGYFRLYPFWLTKRLLKLRQQQIPSPFVFYLHPWELDPGQPRFDNASRLSRFRHYNNLSHVETRLRSLLKEFRFSSMDAVLGNVSDLPAHRY